MHQRPLSEQRAGLLPAPKSQFPSIFRIEGPSRSPSWHPFRSDDRNRKARISYIQQGQRTLLRPAARRSGPAWPPGFPGSGAGRRSAGRASRTPPRSPIGTGPPHRQCHHRSSGQVRRCQPPLPSAKRNPRTATNTALSSLSPTAARLPAALAPFSRPPSASPPDLTRGHLTPAPALRQSPVNGDAGRKESSVYARSGPASDQ